MAEQKSLFDDETESPEPETPLGQVEFVPVDEVKAAKENKKSRQAFYTPLELIAATVEEMPVFTGCLALEPSAGDGRIVHELMQAGCSVDFCEIDRDMRDRCSAIGGNCVGEDFLKVTPVPKYNVIFMNPPFRGTEFKKHIEHAYRFLRPNGELRAVAPKTAIEMILAQQFNLPGCQYLTYEVLCKETFKESGANVETVIMTVFGTAKLPGVEGFENGPTFNAAVSIASDYELSKNYSRSKAIRFIGQSGGSVYGINWNEVEDYIQPMRSSP